MRGRLDGGATLVEAEGKRFFLLDESVHEQLLDSLATRGLPLRAASKPAQA